MKITVVGLGYVGTVAAAGLALAGHEVLAVDIERERIRWLQEGRVPFYEPGLTSRVATGVLAGSLRFLHCDQVVEELGQAAVICTGTPSTAGGGVDLQQVAAAVEWVKAQRHRNLVLVMKSTVPPGNGKKIRERRLNGSGIRYVANPEFLREGQAIHDWEAPDRIVVGVEVDDQESAETVKQMHEGINAPFLVTDVTSAEMIKYASNAFLATRISFINEIASLCDAVGASIDEVSQGLAQDSRTGARIHAGVGYGGSCFPKDVKALDHLALTSGANVEVLRAVINTNNRQRLLPLYSFRRRFDGGLAHRKIGVLGLAFKPGTDDLREAPALDLIRALLGDGADVMAYDPRPADTARSLLPEGVAMADSVAEAARGTQALALMTEWPEIVESNWEEVARLVAPPRILFDGRNALDPKFMDALGFDYMGVGRGVALPTSGSIPATPSAPLSTISYSATGSSPGVNGI